MRTAIALVPAWLAALACAAQTMPYPVGWVYTTSVLDEDSLVLVASTVSDTGGESGHTTSAAVKITSPDSRVAYAAGAWAYSSFASTGLSLCDTAGTCYDGQFLARSEGTQEYCPIASVYMVVSESMSQNQVEPYAYPKSARWVPSAIPYQNGESHFIFTVAKTPTCGGGNATLEMSVAKNPSVLLVTIVPDPGSQRIVAFTGHEASAGWELKTPGSNNTIGTVQGTGRLMGAPCRILPNAPQNSKDATLQVEAP